MVDYKEYGLMAICSAAFYLTCIIGKQAYITSKVITDIQK
jgi:hypothetical protein